MEYAASNAASAQLLSAKPMPELGRLKAAAERVNMATSKVEYFLNRFHGPKPEGVGNPTVDSIDCYRNDMDSLFNALERLESAVTALDHIG